MPPFVVVTGGRSACEPWLSLISFSPWYLAPRCGGADESEMRIVLAAGNHAGASPSRKDTASLTVQIRLVPGLHAVQGERRPVGRSRHYPGGGGGHRSAMRDAADSRQGSGG